MSRVNHVRRGREALKARRTGALERLLKVSGPNARQQQEIESLQQKVKSYDY